MMTLPSALPPASVTSVLSDHSQSTKCFSDPLPCLLHPSPGKPIIRTGDSLPSGSREPSLSVRCETSSSLVCPMALSQEETQGWVVAPYPDPLNTSLRRVLAHPLRPPPAPAQTPGVYLGTNNSSRHLPTKCDVFACIASTRNPFEHQTPFLSLLNFLILTR